MEKICVMSGQENNQVRLKLCCATVLSCTSGTGQVSASNHIDHWQLWEFAWPMIERNSYNRQSESSYLLVSKYSNLLVRVWKQHLMVGLSSWKMQFMHLQCSQFEWNKYFVTVTLSAYSGLDGLWRSFVEQLAHEFYLWILEQLRWKCNKSRWVIKKLS